MLSPLLSGIDKKMPFGVPEGYFNELSATVAAHIAGGAQDDPLSSLLAGLKDKEVYQAPEGYFDELPDMLLAKVKHPAPAKIVSLSQKRNWWKYAAAAVMTGLILTGGWLKLYNSGNRAGTIDIAKSLPTVSDQEIENYLDTNVPLADAVANSSASLDISDSDIKNMFGDIPDAELKQYMDEHEAIKDPATN
jgi:hypothetical protein